MIDEAIAKAVKAVCEEDNMDESYQRALATLIELAMLSNLDTSDIHDLLDKIVIEDTVDEN